jgi:hypothetical protein
MWGSATRLRRRPVIFSRSIRDPTSPRAMESAHDPNTRSLAATHLCRSSAGCRLVSEALRGHLPRRVCVRAKGVPGVGRRIWRL